MTVQEVIEYLEQHGFIADEVKDMCIEALVQVEQYRALGTVEEVTNQKHNLSVAYKCIEELQQPKADWIPCEERLPELDEGTECFKQSKEYLVTVQWWDKETNVDIGWYNQNGMWSNDSKNCKVIAWQPRPLPQPYKKEGAE